MPTNAPRIIRPQTAATAGEACAIFLAAAQLMLDPATPEHVRCESEPLLVAQLPALRALGVFDLFELRDPALKAWLADELDGLEPEHHQHKR
ncbi:MAG: hypothetical protein ABI178_01715 [Rhodanobacter sp.]